MIRAVRKFLGLVRYERLLLLEAVAMLPLAAFGLKTIGLRRSFRLLARGKSDAPGCSLGGTTARRRALRTGVLVGLAAAHGPVRGSCLAQSLTIWWLLRRQGIPADLCIGVRRRAGRLEAHAWMEYRGAVLNVDTNVDGPFAPFSSDRGLLERLGTEMP
jgi:hypothetical protein